MWSKRKGTTSVRKNIFAEDFDTVKESMFWQDHGYHWLNGNIYRGINGATVVTMGDFNAHLQTFRSNQSWNARERLLQTMLTKLNLCAVDTEAYCVEQTNTYISSCWNSMIDYILIEKQYWSWRNSGKEISFIKVRIAWIKRTTNNIEMYVEELSKLLPADILLEELSETSADNWYSCVASLPSNHWSWSDAATYSIQQEN